MKVGDIVVIEQKRVKEHLNLAQPRIFGTITRKRESEKLGKLYLVDCGIFHFEFLEREIRIVKEKKQTKKGKKCQVNKLWSCENPK